MNETILIIGRAGMEIAWRYAWALFLIRLAMGIHFPLPAAGCAFLIAAVMTQLPAGRNWRVYQIWLLNMAGFVLAALLILHPIHYSNFSFFSIEWISHLILGAKSFAQWLLLILTLFCVWLVWRGGHILMKSSMRYFTVCIHFDKGLGLLFLLLIVRLFIDVTLGVSLKGRDFMFLAAAYFVFSLTAISIARDQGAMNKSFLSGRHGVGVILSISTVVTLLGFGTIFLIYPYLYHVADSVIFVTKAVARPLMPVLIKTILFLFRPMAENAQTVTPQTDGQGLSQTETQRLTDMDSFVVGEWEALILKAVGWGVFGFIGLVFLMGAGAFLIYVVRMMLKRSRGEAVQPLSTEAIWAFIRVFAGLPLHVWRALTSLLKGRDCAAMVYAGLCRWGRRSGLPPKHNETPHEYGERLSNSFPALKTQIALIVHAFNREVYGQTPTGRDMLPCLRTALRRMKSLRYLPIRAKVWFLR